MPALTHPPLHPWLEAAFARRRLLVWLAHVPLFVAAHAGAHLLRLDLDVGAAWAQLGAPWLLAVVAARSLAGALGGSFAGLWRYAGLRDLRIICSTTLAGSLALATLAYGRGAGAPASVWLLDGGLCLGLTGGLRLAVRAALQLSRRAGLAPLPRRLLVIGAGDAGEQLLRTLQMERTGAFVAVGLLDDDPRKRGARLHGVRVVGPIDAAATHAAQLAAAEMVIALPSADGPLLRRIFAAARATGLPVRTLPGLAQRIGGPVAVGELREVAVEDLLGRAPVQIDAAAVRALVRGRTVLVTGAGGSIGSELCRQLLGHAPRRLVMVEQAEQPLFALEAELAQHDAEPAPALAPEPGPGAEPAWAPRQATRRGYIANVCDARRMRTIFLHERPDIVLHAAAHKHVAMMERNPGAAVRNNALGTQVVAELAHAHGCGHFVLVSTDKAVNPTSVMGASKRIAELFVQALAATSSTHFAVVRFGNVLASQGSVVPIFRAQIRAGGPLTLTHRDAARYFMTCDEACRLVLQAAALGGAGTLYVLDMGEPVRIEALAHALVALSGRAVGRDIAIEEIGLRPGEKLVEQLVVDDEKFAPTGHPKIARACAAPRALAPMRAALAELEALCEQVVSLPQIAQVLRRVVPEYRPAPGAPGLDVVRPVAMYR